MGGWKTRRRFLRYSIVDERDIDDAANKYDAYLDTEVAEGRPHSVLHPRATVPAGRASVACPPRAVLRRMRSISASSTFITMSSSIARRHAVISGCSSAGRRLATLRAASSTASEARF